VADRLELKVREMRRHTHSSDSQIVLVKKENKQLMDEPKVFSGKTTDNFQVWHNSIKTYFWYERKKFTVDADKIDWLSGQLEGKALFWHQAHEEPFEMSYHRDIWAQNDEALCECFLSTAEDKWDLKIMSALRYKRDIEHYMTQKTYYNTKLGLKGPA
jgi:hypothetical protein